MNSKTVSQLKALARNLGSRLRKAINRVTGKVELIDFINDVPTPEERLSKQTTYLNNPLTYSVKYLILTFQSLNQQLSQQHPISCQM